MFKKIAENLTNKEWHSVMTKDISIDELAVNVKNERIPAWYKPVLEHSVSGDSMLELGSGTGQLSAMLSINNRITHLLDYSQESIDFSKMLFKKLDLAGYFYCADILKGLSLDDNSIDWVWSSGLLEHFNDNEITAILKESLRVSKKGVMSLVPNANAIFYRIGKLKMENEGTWPYGTETPKFTMKEIFAKVRLINIKEYSIDIDTGLNYFKYGSEHVNKFFKSISKEEARQLNQGYLLFTRGEK